MPNTSLNTKGERIITDGHHGNPKLKIYSHEPIRTARTS